MTTLASSLISYKVNDRARECLTAQPSTYSG
jgi:hypothetical protein